MWFCFLTNTELLLYWCKEIGILDQFGHALTLDHNTELFANGKWDASMYCMQ